MGLTMTTLDTRQLIPLNYEQMTVEELVQLKENLWHSIVQTENGVLAMHHEFNIVKTVIKEKGKSEPLPDSEAS